MLRGRNEIKMIKKSSEKRNVHANSIKYRLLNNVFTIPGAVSSIKREMRLKAFSH